MKHLLLTLIPLCMVACTARQPQSLLILHTNDTHSQVEPIATGARNGGMGGYARRMALLDQIRKENPGLLLLDAGDFSQGTPYYNFGHGRIEIDAMNRMRYDAATLGNHEFDYGMDTLALMLRMADFPVVCCNYDVTGTPLQGLVKPYVIIHRNGLKIGITGIGVEPDGLIHADNCRGIVCSDPVTAANDIAGLLKRQKQCDLVICLSHIGSEYEDDRPSDTRLAATSRHIDAIIGGHTHEMVQKKVANLRGDSVPVVQMGKSGAYLGSLTLSCR